MTEPVSSTSTPAQPTKKKGPSKKVIAASAVVVLVALAAIGGNKESPSPAATTGATLPPITATNTPEAALPTETPTSVATTTPTTPTPVVLLDLKGNGIKTSKPFTTTESWTLAYSYDCSSFFGGRGNFQVYVYEGQSLVGISVNELGKKGSDTTTEYDTGELHLKMNSECKWHVKVTQP